MVKKKQKTEKTSKLQFTMNIFNFNFCQSSKLSHSSCHSVVILNSSIYLLLIGSTFDVEWVMMIVIHLVFLASCQCDYYIRSAVADSLVLSLQRMSQLLRPHQGARVGWGWRHQVSREAEVQAGVRWLPRSNYHRGPHSEWRDGCLVQSGSVGLKSTSLTV